MNRKIILALSVLVIAVFACAVAAANSNQVTIDGIDFNIPDGFKEDKSEEIINETRESGVSYIVNGKCYQKGGKVFAILVSEYEDYEVTDEIVASVGGDPKTFNGTDGYLTTDSGYKVFSYPKDGKLVAISVNDESLIEQIIINS